MRTMASKHNPERVSFDLDGYIGKLELMRTWAAEASDSTRDDKERKHLQDIINCYSFAIEQTLIFVKGEHHSGP